VAIVYLNGNFLPIEEAKISPLDRGFLFGDGIYEVIPSYNGRMVGAHYHLERMRNGLSEINIDVDYVEEDWIKLCQNLCEKNGFGALGIYIHISRGADNKRQHAYPENITPTIFIMTFEIPFPALPDRKKVQGYSLKTTRDLRWQRCNIKSTALLGNVLHYQQGVEADCDEVLLFNDNAQITEASTSNVFIVKNGIIITPRLDHQILSGVTRKLIIKILQDKGEFIIEERVITLAEVRQADEIWICSSSKEIVPVVALDNQPVNDGLPGAIWEKVAKVYHQSKFDY
jgi:D-alanine transaminase